MEFAKEELAEAKRQIDSTLHKLRQTRKTLEAKKDKTEDQREMLRIISASYDISDRKYIQPILDCLKN